MRKIAYAVMALLLVACGNNKEKNASSMEVESIVSVESTEPAEAEPIDTVAIRNKAVNELKSWGAKDARFDDEGYLVYAVATTDLSAPAEEVARQMYSLFMETPTLNGVRVVDYIDNSELGRYPKTPCNEQ